MVVSFTTMDDLVDFARSLAPVGTALYKADVLDREFSSPKDGFVIRPNGDKPDHRKIADF